MVDGIIRVIQEVAGDLGPCEKALSPIMSDVEALVNTFESKDYSKMLKDLASALDKLRKLCKLTHVT